MQMLDMENDVRVCLGGVDQTYDLCFDCAEEVEHFIKGDDDNEDFDLE